MRELGKLFQERLEQNDMRAQEDRAQVKGKGRGGKVIERVRKQRERMERNGEWQREQAHNKFAVRECVLGRSAGV